MPSKRSPLSLLNPLIPLTKPLTSTTPRLGRNFLVRTELSIPSNPRISPLHVHGRYQSLWQIHQECKYPFRDNGLLLSSLRTTLSTSKPLCRGYCTWTKGTLARTDQLDPSTDHRAAESVMGPRLALSELSFTPEDAASAPPSSPSLQICPPSAVVLDSPLPWPLECVSYCLLPRQEIKNLNPETWPARNLATHRDGPLNLETPRIWRPDNKS
ncbi:hypothetical protein PGT21_000452 [Puccinia graminis f. sp. tritici]|uniref:Uncharacterized protein n=1 Tax=Puccinia graminis f. sp. tritici TaxID=56615 RepID=A0A5B0NTD3_PUCGR|nr:hypothetical protein PGT21_000452 [Puccinia graminis f. sp. tritici]